MEGKVDLAFILDECKTEDALHVEPLMKEELKVVAAQGIIYSSKLLFR